MLITAPECSFEVERGPNCLFVRVKNLPSNPASHPGLIEHIWSLADRHMTYRLVLELDELPEVDAAFAEQLAELRDRICAHGGILRVCGLSSACLNALRSGLEEERFPAYHDRVEAVMTSFRPRPR